MILKHRDTEVLRFDWMEPFGVKNVEVNSAAERFLPLAFRDEMIDRLRLLKGFRFKHDKSFSFPAARMEVIQYFFQKRIVEICDYRSEADRFIKIDRPDDTIKQENAENSTPEDLRALIFAALKLFPTISRQQLSERLDIGPATVARHIKALQESGKLKRVGSRKTGYWEIIE